MKCEQKDYRMINKELQSIKQRFNIIGNSPLLLRAIEVAALVAPTSMSVLVSGESGSGKESFSKIIHQLSPRKHAPFIAVNCGAIPQGTMDSELFGHEKGAFTGATDNRKGYFEACSKGTIFLDEIGEMPLNTQARLLRVLENGEYIKVGSSKVLKTDVRVVAATNVRLHEAVQDGKFREDLYYRLNTVPIYVPPLRDRGNDTLILFKKFAIDFAEKYRTRPVFLTEDAQFELLKFRFPGNVRQLKHLVEQISILEMDKEIKVNTLKKYLTTESGLIKLPDQRDGVNSDADNKGALDLVYKFMFELRSEVNKLKDLVLKIVQNDKVDLEAVEALKQLDNVMNTIEPEHSYQERTPSKRILLESNNPSKELPIQPNNNISVDTDNHAEITEYTELDSKPLSNSLSIEDNEKNLIVKALKLHQNKRKLAAKDLGISERTLYRKIKQYDIKE